MDMDIVEAERKAEKNNKALISRRIRRGRVGPERLQRGIKMIADNAARLERKADKLRRENRQREADFAAGVVSHAEILCQGNRNTAAAGYQSFQT
jgi:hypothetical protein